MFMLTLCPFFKLDFIREDDICMYEVLYLFECSSSCCREKILFSIRDVASYSFPSHVMF